MSSQSPRPEAQRPRDLLLIIGLGNLICQDDGLGIAAVNMVGARYEVPDGAALMDGGTLGLSLLPFIEEAGTVIMLDAIRSDEPPGSLVRLVGDDVLPAVATRLSPHQIGVVDLLDGARLRDRLPDRIVLWGIVPECIDLGLERSAAVERCLPDLVERAVEEAATLGFEFRPRAIHEVVTIDARGLADGVGLR